MINTPATEEGEDMVRLSTTIRLFNVQRQAGHSPVPLSENCMEVICSKREMTAINNVHSLEGSRVWGDMKIRSRNPLASPQTTLRVSQLGLQKSLLSVIYTPPCHGRRGWLPLTQKQLDESNIRLVQKQKGHIGKIDLSVFSTSLWSQVVYWANH